MPVRGPWYLSVSAVRDYLRITGRPDVTDGPVFHRAEEELLKICQRAVERAESNPNVVSESASGLLCYRAGKPLELQLIIAPDSRAEGRLPQLVQVKPGRSLAETARVYARSVGQSSRPERTLRERAEDTLEELRRRLPELKASELRKIVEFGENL